jgi:hypothetical protein
MVNTTDAASLQDFMPRLKDHLLRRITEGSAPGVSGTDAGTSVPDNIGRTTANGDRVFIKGHRMYRHHIARFNYTTYDVRRSQDVINPGTTHRDIMLLANDGDESNADHPFYYARVLGIYHVNVIYMEEGMQDYAPRTMEFLWVRWFEYDGNRSVAWADLKLDSVRFPPMASEGAFGFVDPKDVLRGAHIIPAFAKGKARRDGIGLSRLAKDAPDWAYYRVNRYKHWATLRLYPSDENFLGLLIVIW